MGLAIMTILLLVLAAVAAAYEPCSFCDTKVVILDAGGEARVRIGYQIHVSSGVQYKQVELYLPTWHGTASFVMSKVVPCNSANQEVNYVQVDSNRRAHSTCVWTILPAPFEAVSSVYRSCMKDQYKSNSAFSKRCKSGDNFKVIYYKGAKTCRPVSGNRKDECPPPYSPPSGGGGGGGGGCNRFQGFEDQDGVKKIVADC